ncbi:MAG TPA: ATP-binding cassette domain-containing protein, partial [Streptosporangiaceae bacterium]
GWQPRAEGTPMIEAQDLTKRYGSTAAVDRISFTVRPGLVTGFLGPNGAGKSTTMRMIMGLDRPTAGTVRVNGQPYGHLKRPLHQVGAVLEVRAVHGGRSAYHHLLCLAQSNGIGKRRVHEVLETVGLTGVAGQRAKAFSLGMSQRLGVAAALLGDPGVLVCDEPVNGLDPEGIRWIRTLLRRLAAEGRTVLVSSHLMSEMALTADHLLVIGKGRILADGSMESVISRVASTTVTIASPRMGDLLPLLRAAGAAVRSSGPQAAQVTGISGARVGDLAASASIPLHRLDEAGPSLEDAFMELTSGSVQFSASGGSSQ